MRHLHRSLRQRYPGPQTTFMQTHFPRRMPYEMARRTDVAGELEVPNVQPAHFSAVA